MQSHGCSDYSRTEEIPGGCRAGRCSRLDGVVESDLLTRLRADLLTAVYTVDRVQQLWGPDADAALHRGDRVLALRKARAAGPEPVALLARLFRLHDELTGPELAAAFPALGVEGASALGLVDEAGRARVDVGPLTALDSAGAAEWWIVSDLDEHALGGALPPGHVLGVGGASLTLAGLQPTTPVRSALDLGTGCGVQSLFAARGAERVVATDVSPRALELAGATFALSAVDTVELRHGDLYVPVTGERFDRIVSNPPFVITPRREGVPLYEHRDGGRVGDGIVEEVVRGAADHLVPGGTAHILGNWEYRDDEDGLSRVARWLELAGLDGWVIERERQSPAEYAATWIRDGGTRAGTPEFERLAGEWIDDFAARGVVGVGFGYLVLRHPAPGTATLRRTEVVASPRPDTSAGLGDTLLAGFAMHDRLAPLDDAALAELRCAVAGDVTEERHYWPGAEGPTVIRLRQGGGLAREIEADAALAGFVGASDGGLSVGEIASALAHLLEVEEGALLEQLLPQVRELLVTGLLTLSE
ncbi:methyltransferase [Chryseoglobus sp. 28M-23]|nr:methyltransferase [Chryseoglobus sp. 28M-23]